jgi:hypothetical protein
MPSSQRTSSKEEARLAKEDDDLQFAHAPTSKEEFEDKSALLLLGSD